MCIKRVLRVFLTAVAVVGLSRCDAADLSIHYPTSQVYRTGTPSSGTKHIGYFCEFKVYENEQTPWASGTFGDPPGVPLEGWNISLNWTMKAPETAATAKAWSLDAVYKSVTTTSY